MDSYITEYKYILNKVSLMSAHEVMKILDNSDISFKELTPTNKGLTAHYITSNRLFGTGFKSIDGFVYDVTNDAMIPKIVAEYLVANESYFKGSDTEEDDIVGLPLDIMDLTDDHSGMSNYDEIADQYPELVNGLEYVDVEPFRESSIDYMDAWDDYNKATEPEPADPTKPPVQEREMDAEMKQTADIITAYNKQKSRYTRALDSDTRIALTYYNQMPWGYLHPDYNNPIVFEGVKYPSATNAIYASILFTTVDKRIISNTGNAMLASIKAEKFFTQYIENVMIQAVYDYYYNAMAAGEKVNFIELQITDMSMPFALYIQKGGDMLVKEFDPENKTSNGDFPDVYTLKSDIDGYLFHNIFDYIDFKLSNLFQMKGDTIADMQNAYLEAKVYNACKEIVESRMRDDIHFARLIATVWNVKVKTRGYLKNYVDVIYTDILEKVRTSRAVKNRRIEKYHIVDAARYLKLEKWYEDRAREVVTMLSVFEKELAYKLDAFHVQQIIGHVYACTATDENLLFQFYPRSFFMLIQSEWKKAFNRRADHSIVYEIWKFICSLVFYVTQFSIPGADYFDFVAQCQDKVKNTYSIVEVTRSIDNAIQILDSLFSKIPGDLSSEKKLALLSGIFNPTAGLPTSLTKLKDRLVNERGRHTRSIIYLFS